MATEQGSKAVEAGVRQSAEADTAIRLLRAKYAEYERWTTPFGAATVMLVERWSSWTI